MSIETDRISPTAHYTGYVWYRHGLSHPALMTNRGRLLFYALHPAALVYDKVLRGPTLEDVLLRRHLVIDRLLEDAIERGEITQVVEIAAGLSPRGYRTCQRFGPDLVYLEADLAHMADLKRRILDEAGLSSPNHRVLECNALATDGPHSLAALASRWLDPSQGTAIITEGLLNYFAAGDVRGLWKRCADVLSGFPTGLYLSDLHVWDESMTRRAARLFRILLEVFARGEIHLHFRDARRASKALVDAGFESAVMHQPRAFEASLPIPRIADDLVRVIEARTARAAVAAPASDTLH